jgi:hypothetical protein
METSIEFIRPNWKGKTREPEQSKLLDNFEPISLKKSEKVKLLDRYSSKFWLRENQLNELLLLLKDDYYILEINGIREQKYNSFYFDTPEDVLYKNHHNGKANRAKIRKREYIDSGDCFLEIKIKSNKGKTLKYRIPSNTSPCEFTSDEKDFLHGHYDADCKNLLTKIFNSFYRITLVSKDFRERCTIDTNIEFATGNKTVRINGLSILEIKQKQKIQKSKLTESLGNLKIYPEGFSKYCMGRALVEPDIKKNNFKPLLLKIQRRFELTVNVS